MRKYLIATLAAISVGLAAPAFAMDKTTGALIGGGIGYYVGHNHMKHHKHGEAIGTGVGAVIGATVAGNDRHRHRNRNRQRVQYREPVYYSAPPRYYEERVYSRPYYDDGYYYDY